MARLDKASQLIEGAVGLGRLRLCSEVFSQVVFEQRYEVSLRIAVVGQLLTLANYCREGVHFGQQCLLRHLGDIWLNSAFAR
jgi:hypothetical protein